MTALAVTAATNFALSGEALILAILTAKTTRTRYSAAWYFAGVLAFLGAAAFLGGIDHGFLEPGNLPRYWVQRSTWILLGATTFCLLMTTAKQFFPAPWQNKVAVLALIQFAVNIVVVLRIDSFLDVILNYAPVMILFLVLNVMKSTGSWQMIVGLLVQSGASAIQALGVDNFSPLDHNGLYHVISMVAVLFLYWGGRRLSTSRTIS